MDKKQKKEMLFKLLFLFVGIVACLLLSGCNPKDYDVSLEELEKDYMSHCWSCSIFKTIFAALDSLIIVFYHEIANGALALMAISFAIWILFHVGKLFLSFKMPDVNQFWTDSLKTSFAVLCCGVLLMSADTIFALISYTIVPVFQGFIDLSLAVINSGFGSYGTNYSACNNTFDSMVIDSGHALQQGVSDAFSCLIAKMHTRMVYGNFFAQKMIASGDFIAVVFGICIFLVFGVLNFLFPFYIVDGLFKLGIAFVLLPIFIAFWPFKLLRQYAIVGWNIFLSTFMQIVMIAIFLILAIEIMVQFTMKLDIFDPEKLILNQPEVLQGYVSRQDEMLDPSSGVVMPRTCIKYKTTIGEEKETCVVGYKSDSLWKCVSDELMVGDKSSVGDICYMETGKIIDANPKFVESNLNFPIAMFLMIFLGLYLIKLIGTMNRMAAQFAGAKANSAVFSKAMSRLMRAGALIAQGGVGLAMLAAMKKGGGNNAQP